MTGLEDVSRETLERLEIYARLLEKWNRRINLVSSQSLAGLWGRHFIDSAQIFQLAAHPVRHWADLGSGGGFPGLVIAILGLEHGSPEKLTLIESDARKCAFLRNVARETDVRVDVINERIEKAPPLDADVISARALCNLDCLMSFAEMHLRPGGRAIFPKGRAWQNELAHAQSGWHFEHEVVKSTSEPGSTILIVTGATRV